jgi:hypothetical protein
VTNVQKAGRDDPSLASPACGRPWQARTPASPRADLTFPFPPADPLPPGCARDAANATKLSCALGRIHPGASTNMTVAVPIPAGFPNGRGQRLTVSATGAVGAVGGSHVDETAVTTRVIAVPTKVTPTPVLTRLLPGVDIYVFVLTARLARADNDRPVVGRSLQFRTGGNVGSGTLLCTAVTDSGGVARCPGVLRTVGALLGLGYNVTWDAQHHRFAGDAHRIAMSLPRYRLSLSPFPRW